MRFFEFKTTLIEASGLINRKAGDEWVNPNDPTDIIKFVGNSYTAYPEDELQFESVEDRDLAVEEITKEYPDITFSNSPTNATLAFAIVLFDTTQPQQQKAYTPSIHNPANHTQQRHPEPTTDSGTNHSLLDPKGMLIILTDVGL